MLEFIPVFSSGDRDVAVDVVTDGFTPYCCGPKLMPNALVAAYEWEQYVDLLTIRDFSRVTTARVPRRGAVDIFAPEVVVWAYEGAPQQAIRALLDLVHPAHPNRAHSRVSGASGPACSPPPATSNDDRELCAVIVPWLIHAVGDHQRPLFLYARVPMR